MQGLTYFCASEEATLEATAATTASSVQTATKAVKAALAKADSPMPILNFKSNFLSQIMQ